MNSYKLKILSENRKLAGKIFEFKGIVYRAHDDLGKISDTIFRDPRSKKYLTEFETNEFSKILDSNLEYCSTIFDKLNIIKKASLKLPDSSDLNTSIGEINNLIDQYNGIDDTSLILDIELKPLLKERLQSLKNTGGSVFFLDEIDFVLRKLQNVSKSKLSTFSLPGANLSTRTSNRSNFGASYIKSDIHPAYPNNASSANNNNNNNARFAAVQALLGYEGNKRNNGYTVNTNSNNDKSWPNSNNDEFCGCTEI